jgi:hypothetical protein
MSLDADVFESKQIFYPKIENKSFRNSQLRKNNRNQLHDLKRDLYSVRYSDKNIKNRSFMLPESKITKRARSHNYIWDNTKSYLPSVKQAKNKKRKSIVMKSPYETRNYELNKAINFDDDDEDDIL